MRSENCSPIWLPLVGLNDPVFDRRYYAQTGAVIDFEGLPDWHDRGHAFLR